ncbi:MAG: peptidoglycan/LPS O-acetylase OafA/YrhL [Crocinitomicaceae bacterium]|jgi:peptidoglycan/LPS O-acetylase OafA/YrhL
MTYIKGFDSLRAFSIALVILAHLGLKAGLPDIDYVQTRVWGFLSGGTGVNVFFTLSGFLITSILIAEKFRLGKISLKNFYVRRFLRLLPPLIVFYIAVAILMNQGLIHNSSIGFFYSLFYVYNFVPTHHYSGELGHTWSLALEEQFYIVWPFVINFFRSYRGVILLIYGIILVSVVFVFVYPDITRLKGYFPSRWFIPAVSPVLIGSYFAILNDIYKKRWSEIFKGNYTLLILALVLFVCALYAPLFLFPTLFFFQAIAISLLLVWISYNQSSRFVALLDNKLMSYIGKISYGLYVYQGLFLRTGPGGDLWIQQFPQNILLTVCAAVLSYHLLEKPVLTLKGRFRS